MEKCNRYSAYLLFCLAICAMSVSAVNARQVKNAQAAAQSSKIIIAVAANIVLPMTKVKTLFEKDNPGVTVDVIPGSSGKLAMQIENGAPFDLFASADMAFPEALRKKGLVERGPEVYAQGSLVMYDPEARDMSGGLSLLLRSSVKRIVIANPETAPYGKAAVEALKNSGIYHIVKDKLIIAENVNKVVPIVDAGADIGFTARSAVYDPGDAGKYSEKINWIAVDASLYQPLMQGAVLLKKSKINGNAALFYEYIFSEKARAVYCKYGYTVPHTVR